MFQGIVFIVLFACLLQQIQSIVAIQIACNREYYGAPNLQDCEALLSLLPYDDQERLFDEEQLRLPDSLNYPGVDNVYPSQVFQIPAYWSLSMSTRPDTRLDTSAVLLGVANEVHDRDMQSGLDELQCTTGISRRSRSLELEDYSSEC